MAEKEVKDLVARLSAASLSACEEQRGASSSHPPAPLHLLLLLPLTSYSLFLGPVSQPSPPPAVSFPYHPHLLPHLLLALILPLLLLLNSSISFSRPPNLALLFLFLFLSSFSYSIIFHIFSLPLSFPFLFLLLLQHLTSCSSLSPSPGSAAPPTLSSPPLLILASLLLAPSPYLQLLTSCCGCSTYFNFSSARPLTSSSH